METPTHQDEKDNFQAVICKCGLVMVGGKCNSQTICDYDKCNNKTILVDEYFYHCPSGNINHRVNYCQDCAHQSVIVSSDANSSNNDISNSNNNNNNYNSNNNDIKVVCICGATLLP